MGACTHAPLIPGFLAWVLAPTLLFRQAVGSGVYAGIPCGRSGRRFHVFFFRFFRSRPGADRAEQSAAAWGLATSLAATDQGRNGKVCTEKAYGEFPG